MNTFKTQTASWAMVMRVRSALRAVVSANHMTCRVRTDRHNDTVSISYNIGSEQREFIQQRLSTPINVLVGHLAAHIQNALNNEG